MQRPEPDVDRDWAPAPGAVGVVIGDCPPEDICSTAKRAEELGFDELWLAEDYFFEAGMSTAAAVLEVTTALPIGVGVLSAVTRHPALLGMEIATTARMHPDRFLPAIGLGDVGWLNQMAVAPRSPLTAMRESVTSLQALLAGETLTKQGTYFSFDEVALEYPPHCRVPLYIGGMGPKMLQQSGRIADGTVLSVLASPQYVAWAVDRIAEGAAGNEVEQQHRVVAYALMSIDHDGDRARKVARDALASNLMEIPVSAPLVFVNGIADELSELQALPLEELTARLPDEWVKTMCVAGNPADCASAIQQLFDAGADSVSLMPVRSDQAVQQLELVADEVLPVVRASRNSDAPRRSEPSGPSPTTHDYRNEPRSPITSNGTR